MSGVCKGPEVGVGSARTGVTDSSEPSCGF